MEDLVSMRLAIQKFPSPTSYAPQLADSWTAANGKLTVHIRSGVKWQDGTPVTSKDLYDTVVLDGLRGDQLWQDITAATVQDASTVAFTLREGQPIALAEHDILNNGVVYPSSIYGKFVTAQLAKDVPAYFAKNQKDPAAAEKTPENARIQAAFKDLAALPVDKLLGDGPFQLDSITTSAARLTKSNDFYAADKIKVPGINFGNGSNQTIYPQMFSGQADFTNVYLSPPLLKRWQSTDGAQLATPSAFGFVMSFNNQQYPLNMTPVRQALAYVIPRQTMTEAAYGGGAGAGGAFKQVLTGISPTLEALYLTPQQISSLNPYPLDPGKATQLLKSAGFTQSNGQWTMPNGKPFTLALTVNSDTSDIVTSYTSAAKALTAFGIATQVNAVPGAQQDADQKNGTFQAGMVFVGESNPLTMYRDMMGPIVNFPQQGNYAGKRGNGIGPKANVPGQGTINIPATLDAQAGNVAPGQQMKDDTWSWAQFVNQQVPYIWYATKVYQFSYSTAHYGNWPPVDSSGAGPLWSIISNNQSGGLVLAIEQGYIVPKG